jgi:hypothetical protein
MGLKSTQDKKFQEENVVAINIFCYQNDKTICYIYIFKNAGGF